MGDDVVSDERLGVDGRSSEEGDAERAAAGAGRARAWRLVPWLALVLAVLLGAFLLAQRPNRVSWDQYELLTLTSERGRPPIYSDGVVSKWIVTIYRSVVPLRIEEANLHIRILALSAYLLAGFLLAREVLRPPWLLVAFLAVMLASRMPFVWISTELFAGVFVCIAAICLLRKGSPFAVGAIAALGSLTKADMPALMFALVLYDAYRSRSAGRLVRSLGAFAATWLVVTLPWQVQTGEGFYSMDRSLLAFSQHYSSLVFDAGSARRLAPAGGDPRLPQYAESDPFAAWYWHEQVREKEFPGVSSVAEVITRYPLRYLRFFGMALWRSAERIVGFFQLLLVLLACRYAWMAWRREPPGELDRIFFASLLGFVPIVLLVYVHARYLARYLPFVLVLSLDFVDRLPRAGPDARARSAAVAGVVATFAIYVLLFAMEWSALEPQHVFWFRD